MQMPSDNDEKPSAAMQQLEQQLADLTRKEAAEAHQAKAEAEAKAEEAKKAELEAERSRKAADARKSKAPAHKGGTNETLDRLLGPERGD